MEDPSKREKTVNSAEIVQVATVRDDAPQMEENALNVEGQIILHCHKHAQKRNRVKST